MAELVVNLTVAESNSLSFYPLDMKCLALISLVGVALGAPAPEDAAAPVVFLTGMAWVLILMLSHMLPSPWLTMLFTLAWSTLKLSLMSMTLLVMLVRSVMLMLSSFSLLLILMPFHMPTILSPLGWSIPYLRPMLMMLLVMLLRSMSMTLLVMLVRSVRLMPRSFLLVPIPMLMGMLVSPMLSPLLPPLLPTLTELLYL